MKATAIQRDRYYEIQGLGIGQCVDTTRRCPPGFGFLFPRVGLRFVSPRAVVREVPAPEKGDAR